MALWSTVVEILFIGIVIALRSENFPRNVTRSEGADREIILCQLYPAQATPFWKINDSIYYYSDVPPLLEVSKSGRQVIIPVVGSSLNRTTFQCFTPSPSGHELISSSIGVLTVTISETGRLRVPNITNPQPKMVIVHQNLTFFPNTVVVSWRVLNDRRCSHYQLVARHSCDLNSNRMVLVNKTKQDTITLGHEVISNFTYFSVTVYGEHGNQCEELFLESFQFSPGTDTDNVSLCMSDVSDSCLTKPTCIETPPLISGKTLILALPFLPFDGLEEDLLCPIHPLPGQSCVDLLSCNHFRKSAFANVITICRTAMNSSSSLEMCFYNASDIMNETRLHFFFSDLHCLPDGSLHESTRLYTNPIQLHVTKIEDTLTVALNDSNLCVSSECTHHDCMLMLHISIVDKFSCMSHSSQNIMDGSCISLTTLQMNAACVPYHITVEAYNKTIVHKESITEIRDQASNSVLRSSSKCTCHGSQFVHSTRSTQTLAIGVCAILGGIILMLLVFILVAAYKNYKMISK